MTFIEALGALLITSHLHIRVGCCFLNQIPILAFLFLSADSCSCYTYFHYPCALHQWQLVI